MSLKLHCKLWQTLHSLFIFEIRFHCEKYIFSIRDAKIFYTNKQSLLLFFPWYTASMSPKNWHHFQWTCHMWGRSWMRFGYRWQLNGAQTNPSQIGAIPIPQTPYPRFDPLHRPLKRKCPRDSPQLPPSLPIPNTKMPTQSYILQVFFSAGLVGLSPWWGIQCSQTKEETTITLGYWSPLSGLKRLWWGKAGWGARVDRGGGGTKQRS